MYYVRGRLVLLVLYGYRSCGLLVKTGYSQCVCVQTLDYHSSFLLWISGLPLFVLQASVGHFVSDAYSCFGLLP